MRPSKKQFPPMRVPTTNSEKGHAIGVNCRHRRLDRSKAVRLTVPVLASALTLLTSVLGTVNQFAEMRFSCLFTRGRIGRNGPDRTEQNRTGGHQSSSTAPRHTTRVWVNRTRCFPHFRNWVLECCWPTPVT